MRSSHAAFSPDGTRILTASTDKTAKLWDAASGKLIASFAHQDYRQARGVQSGWCSDPHGVLQTIKQTAKLWDAASGKLIASLADPEL